MPLSDEELAESGFVLGERFTSALPENVQLPHVVLEQVGCHLRLLKRVANADGWYVLEEDDSKLVHGLRVYLQRLLQELDTEEVFGPIHLAKHGRFGAGVHAHTDAHDPHVRMGNAKGAGRVGDGVEGRVVRAIPAVNQLHLVAGLCRYGLGSEERECGARGLHRLADGHAKAGLESTLPAVRLGDASLENHRPLDYPFRGDDADGRFHVLELGVLENLPRQLRELGGLFSRLLQPHHVRDVVLVVPVDFIDGHPQRNHCANNRTRARSEDEVEALVQPTAEHTFNFGKNAERVEAFGTSTIQT